MTTDPLNPTVEEFDNFRDVIDSATFLKWARDIFILDTGISDTTNLTTMEQDMVRRAVMHMAWYLEEDHASREDYFSQFNTERIGSYYYSKAGHVTRLSGSEGAVIPAYDYAVEYFLRKSGNDSYVNLWSTTSSEHVFQEGYNTVTATFPMRPVYNSEGISI